MLSVELAVSESTAMA